MVDERTSAAAAARSFHKEIYQLAAIEDAMEVYGSFGSLELDRDGDAWTVHFAEVDEDLDPEVLASEFANYVLVGTIERAR